MTSLDNVPFYLFVILLISVSDVNSKNTTVEEKIKYDSDLSEFYSHLETNAMANATLMYRELTVFAPTNKAFQSYKSNISIDSLVSYHMVTSPVSLDRLYSGQSLPTDFPGNPYVWITRKSQNEIYVNNAKIDRYKSNYVAWNTQRKHQVLHVIGDVLEPVVSTNPDRPIYNPDAFTFLNQSEEIALGSHRLRTFRQRVHQLNKQHIFQAPGHYTFFIPIDDGFTPPPRSDKIDAKVIDGHVVPRYVLFTGPTPQGHEYPTLAMGDMMKVTVSFTQQNDGKHPRTYVRSSTLQGDSTHANGVVLAEIVRANIPVKNGVVHLIHRPLMVVDSTVTQFLKDDVNGPLYKFYRVILEAGGDFMNRINRLREVTLFAPSNEAWNETHLDKVLKDQMKLREILDLHLVESKLPVDQIISNNQKEIFMAPTSNGRRNLYFNVVQGPYNNRTLTVEGGGVNATVIQPDIAATNGVIHIIDHVLGVPYQNVKEKLLTDPMLNKTATLGQKTHFNEQLKNMNRKFTYFVPRDYAWKKAEVQFPSAHKKLFMPEFVYHVQQILERHLVINDRAYTMAELKNMTNDSYITLPTLRDSLKIKVKEVDRTEYYGNFIDDSGESQSRYGGHGYDVTSNYHAPRKGYALEWRGETVHVFRPDVYCTNGIIHVIDRVLLQESDVRVNGEPALGSASLLLNLCLVLIAKFYF